MRKKYLLIGGVITAVLILLLFVVNAAQNGQLEITTPETPNNAQVEVSVVYDNGAIETFTINAKSTRTITARTGTHRINSKVGEVKAVDIVKIAAGQTTRLTLRFATQMTAQKTGTDAIYCPYMVGSTLFTYNCQTKGFIYRHPSADGRKIPIFESRYFGYIKPYGTGFLGFGVNTQTGTSDGQPLQFFDAQTQTAQAVTLPAAIPAANLHNNVTIVTTGDSSKTFFALAVRDQSKIYLFKNINDPQPIAIALPTDKKFKNDNNATSFSFDGDTFIAYIGKIVNAEEHDGQEYSGSGDPDDHSEPAKSDGHIYEYTLDGKLGKTISVPDDFWADSVMRLAQSYYTASNIRSTDVYYSQNDRLERIYGLEDAISSVAHKGQLFMVVDNGVFAFTPQENGLFALENVYNDSKTSVSSLYTSPGPLLFTGSDNEANNALLNVFSLTK